MKSKSIRNILEQRKGERSKTKRDLESYKKKLKDEVKHNRKVEKAKQIVKEVGKKTQDQISYHISDITSLALQSVFKNPYNLITEFVERRDTTECDIWFERDGERIKPLTDSGIGAVDVASFALRIAAWSMKNPRSRPTIILDEPFKHLKGEKENIKVIEMVKEISEKLGLQIIMVHDERVPIEEIEKGADKIFKVSIRNGKSIVK